jgi:hypothetical protein
MRCAARHASNWSWSARPLHCGALLPFRYPLAQDMHHARGVETQHGQRLAPSPHQPSRRGQAGADSRRITSSPRHGQPSTIGVRLWQKQTCADQPGVSPFGPETVIGAHSALQKQSEPRRPVPEAKIHPLLTLAALHAQSFSNSEKEIFNV